MSLQPPRAPAEPPGTQAFWDARYFPALDGMRAISVLLVCINHLASFPPGLPVAGFLGVDVFFVLSGFLITTLLQREREESGAISLKAFYARRAFRIFPVYYLVLVIYVVVTYALHDVKRIGELGLAWPWLVAFLQEYRPEASGTLFGQAWSLGIEEKFYLLWPCVVVLLFPFRPRALASVLVATAGVVFLTPIMYSRCYGALLLGSILAIVLSRSTAGGFARRLLDRIGPAGGLVAIAGAYGIALGHPEFNILFSFGIALFVGALVLRPESAIGRILAHPVLTYPGRRSYSMYLLHVLVLRGVELVFARARVPLTWYVQLAIGYLVTLACAAVLYRSFEKPLLSLGHRLSTRLRARGTSPRPADAVEGTASLSGG